MLLVFALRRRIRPANFDNSLADAVAAASTRRKIAS
jgi:hypothetical protein